MDAFSLGMWAQRVEEQLARIENLIVLLSQRSESMSAELDNLAIEVTQMSTVIDSAILLLQGLSARLAAIADDPAAINALSLELDTKAAELSAAIVANTPPTP